MASLRSLGSRAVNLNPVVTATDSELGQSCVRRRMPNAGAPVAVTDTRVPVTGHLQQRSTTAVWPSAWLANGNIGILMVRHPSDFIVIGGLCTAFRTLTHYPSSRLKPRSRADPTMRRGFRKCSATSIESLTPTRAEICLSWGVAPGPTR